MRKTFWQITALFLIWRITLIIYLIVSLNLVPLYSKDKFLGGGPNNYPISPEIFSWANFDGEHYLSISIFGYRSLQQAFFPVYPKLIGFMTSSIISLIKPFFYIDFFSVLFFSTLTGIIISNLALLIVLVLLWDLVRIDYSAKIAFWTAAILLLFPTSFFFGAVYTESIFLLFTLASFYFARKKIWIAASIFGAVASATRIFGILLLPALIIEAWQQKAKFKNAAWLSLIPLGLFAYMYYQYVTVKDPLAFYNLQKIVGEQHQSGVVFLPQVYFRYIKILILSSMASPIYKTILLEFVCGIVFFALPVYGFFRKVRLSYLFFAMSAFILPTIQGSFSSTPRYVLVLFPSFIAASLLISSLPKWVKVMFVTASFFLLFIEASLFLRGYWVA